MNDVGSRALQLHVLLCLAVLGVTEILDGDSFREHGTWDMGTSLVVRDTHVHWMAPIMS